MTEAEYTIQPWRLIADSEEQDREQERVGDAAWNMAVDETLLHAVASGRSGPILRFYGWNTAAVSLGRFQSIERTMNADAMATERITVVRRITGGRGILHGDDLTISLACKLDVLNLPPNAPISAVYNPIAAAFQQAFAAMGNVTCQGLSPWAKSSDARGDCFAIISPADLIDRRTEAKLLGTALHRMGDSVLMQASLPLRTPQNRTWVQHLSRTLFRGPSSSEVEQEMPSFTPSQTRQAIREAFARQFTATFTCTQLSASETSLAQIQRKQRYESEQWTYRISPGLLRDAIDR